MKDAVEFPAHEYVPHSMTNNFDLSSKPWCPLSNDMDRCHYTTDIATDTYYVCGAISDTHKGLPIIIYRPNSVTKKSKQTTEPDETIDQEAHRIVYGDREEAYDDPNQNFRRLSYMIQGVLDKKLKEDARITPNDVALILQCLKISRESFKPSRENRVDGVGYWLCLDRIVQEQEKQSDAK